MIKISSILIILNMILLVSCGESDKKLFTNSNRKGLQNILREVAIQDSINKAEWDKEKKKRQENFLAAKPYDRHGNFEIDETGYLGDLEITIEKIKKNNIHQDRKSLSYRISQMNPRTTLGVYVKFKNVGDKTLVVPFLFYEESHNSIRNKSRENEDGGYTYFQLGVRMFAKKNSEEKYRYGDLTIKPNEEIKGRYSCTIDNSSEGLSFSFGDEKDEDSDDIPPYYFKDKMNCIFKDSENRNVLQWPIVENEDNKTEEDNIKTK